MFAARSSRAPKTARTEEGRQALDLALEELGLEVEVDLEVEVEELVEEVRLRRATQDRREVALYSR